MPTVGKMKFPYTKKGIADAAKAMKKMKKPSDRKSFVGPLPGTPPIIERPVKKNGKIITLKKPKRLPA